MSEHTETNSRDFFQQVLHLVREHGLAIPLIHVITAPASSNFPPASTPQPARHHVVRIPYPPERLTRPELQPILVEDDHRSCATVEAASVTTGPSSRRGRRVAVLLVGMPTGTTVALDRGPGVDRRTAGAGDRTSLHGYDDGRCYGRTWRPPIGQPNNPDWTTGLRADHCS